MPTEITPRENNEFEAAILVCETNRDMLIAVLATLPVATLRNLAKIADEMDAEFEDTKTRRPRPRQNPSTKNLVTMMTEQYTDDYVQTEPAYTCCEECGHVFVPVDDCPGLHRCFDCGEEHTD